MNQETIAIVRKELDLPNHMSDKEIAAGLEGSYIVARIEFRLAARALGDVMRQCVKDTVAAYRRAGEKARPFDRRW